MADPTSQFLDQITNRPEPPFSLEELPGFPYTDYQKNLSRYTEMERWYSGEILEEQVPTTDQQSISLYPVRINPLQTIVQKHAYTLFGEVEQDDRPLVYPRLIPIEKDKDKEAADHAENILYQAWFENNGRAIQMENAITSQIYGGCIFKVAWDSEEEIKRTRYVPIRLETVHPKCFLGRPSASDMWRLEEAWLIKPLSYQEAKANGVNFGPDEEYWLTEHWTPELMDFKINGVGTSKIVDGEAIEHSGPNPFGLVPFVYIPHMRSSGFYGENAIDTLRGLVKELNLRVADYGDAVSADSHSYLGMRDVQGAPSVQQIAPGLFVVNLQSTPSITGNEPKADLWELRKPSASQPMAVLVDELYKEIRRASFVPTVADGEDEGSQRSGLTLATRFWPLVAHTNQERVFWTAGLNQLNRIILRMLMAKRALGITPVHASMRMKQFWSPVLPRDREVMVNEMVARMGAMLGSPEHLIELLGDVDDIDEEVKKILSFAKKKAKIEAEAQPTPFGGGPAKPGDPKGVKGGTPQPTTPTSSPASEKSKP